MPLEKEKSTHGANLFYFFQLQQVVLLNASPKITSTRNKIREKPEQNNTIDQQTRDLIDRKEN